MFTAMERFFESRKEYGVIFIRLAVGIRIAIGAFDAIRKVGQMEMADLWY